MSNYRKRYEEYLGYKLDKDTDVHHIDHDRSNNSISNLVAIPKELHLKYHSALNKCNELLSIRDMHTPEISFIDNIDNKLDEIRKIILIDGFYSFRVFQALNSLSLEAISLVQSNADYSNYNTMYTNYLVVVDRLQREILDIKYEQDINAQKQIAHL